MTKRRKYVLLVFIALLIFGAYSGLYLNKTLKYLYYNRLDSFGNRGQYFFTQFYRENGRFPRNIRELKDHVIQNNERYIGNSMAEYLTSYNDINLINSKEDSIIWVYLFGFNYTDNQLSEINEHFSEVSFWTFPFTKGDIVLFYGNKDTSHIWAEEVVLDTNVAYPPNVKIQFK